MKQYTLFKNYKRKLEEVISLSLYEKDLPKDKILITILTGSRRHDLN